MEAVSANRSRRVDASRRRADLSGRLSRRRAAQAAAAEQTAAEEAAADEAEEDFTDQALAESEVADMEPEVTEADTVDGGIDEEDAVAGEAANEESAEAGTDKKVEDE
jgi:hypothetical protein